MFSRKKSQGYSCRVKAVYKAIVNRSWILPWGRSGFMPTYMLSSCIRRMTCDADVNILKRLFENPTEDSEVRIAAFIGLMRCPTYLTIRSIKELLEKEQVNQGTPDLPSSSAPHSFRPLSFFSTPYPTYRPMEHVIHFSLYRYFYSWYLRTWARNPRFSSIWFIFLISILFQFSGIICLVLFEKSPRNGTSE